MPELTSLKSGSMPPSVAAWSLLRDRWHLAIAVAISMTVHLVGYLFSPHFINLWQAVTTARYDAVLLPPERELLTTKPAESPKTQIARKTVARPKPQRKPVAAPAVIEPTVDVPTSAASSDADTSAAQIGDVEKTTNALPLAAANAAAAPPDAAEPVAIPTPPAPTPEPPPPELPARISISYKATSSISDGVAEYSWKRDGNKYEVDSSLQASGFVVALFAGVLHQVSHGEITSAGLQPDSFMMRRGDSAPETAEFLRVSNELKLSRNGKSQLLPLPAKIQDTQSFLFQLAFDTPRLKTGEEKLEVLVTNARKVYRHQFRQLGQTNIQTRLGPVTTLHLLSDAADPEDAYEVWLSPEHYYLPVKLKFYAGRFPIELIATSIRSTP